MIRSATAHGADHGLEVEGLVLHVRRMLRAPEVVARTITAVRAGNGAAEDALRSPEEREVIEALGTLEPVWAELYPAEQARASLG
jgi:site-specific DNA recombinase